jgi:hypothetical protein
VGRPPQDLMRGWGRAPVRKASRPDRGLGIRSTCNISERGKKGSCGGERETCEDSRGEEAFEFKEELENKCYGHRNWQRRL